MEVKTHMFEGSSLMILLMVSSLIINLITMIVVIVSFKKNKQSSNQMVQTASVQAAGPKSSAVSGVVFCRNCGNQYDSTHSVCSSCKTPR